MTVPFFVKDAIDHSYQRKLTYPKKITTEMLRKEIELTQVIAEVRGTERVLDMIIRAKKDNKPMSVEDIEAEIHLFIVNGLGYVSKQYSGYHAFPLERVLATHNYYNKEVSSDSKSGDGNTKIG